jgi:hypothetical protein
MMTERVEINIPLSTTFGDLEEVPAVFDIEVEVAEAEPYSWGEGRGTETYVTAKFIELKLGGLLLGENMAIAAFGRDQIIQAEYTAAAEYEQ